MTSGHYDVIYKIFEKLIFTADFKVFVENYHFERSNHKLKIEKTLQKNFSKSHFQQKQCFQNLKNDVIMTGSHQTPPIHA